MCRSSATSNEDSVTVDLLRALDWDSLIIIWKAFQARLNMDEGHLQDPPFWKRLAGATLFKKGFPEILDNYRVTFLACLLQQWFLAVVVHLTRLCVPNQPSFVSGFMAKRQATTRVLTLYLNFVF